MLVIFDNKQTSCYLKLVFSVNLLQVSMYVMCKISVMFCVIRIIGAVCIQVKCLSLRKKKTIILKINELNSFQ